MFDNAKHIAWAMISKYQNNKRKKKFIYDDDNKERDSFYDNVQDDEFLLEDDITDIDQLIELLFDVVERIDNMEKIMLNVSKQIQNELKTFKTEAIERLSNLEEQIAYFSSQFDDLLVEEERENEKNDREDYDDREDHNDREDYDDENEFLEEDRNQDTPGFLDNLKNLVGPDTEEKDKSSVKNYPASSTTSSSIDILNSLVVEEEDISKTNEEDEAINTDDESMTMINKDNENLLKDPSSGLQTNLD